MMPRADTFSLTSPAMRLQRFAWLVVACNIVVILWGGYVRATGSGTGCGNNWPLCNGSILPTTTQAQTMIEFVHRMTSSVVLILVSWLLVWIWRRTPKGAWPRYSVIVATIFLFNEALLGALLVLFAHVVQDRFSGRVILLSLHFGNTLLLLASLSLTAHWLSKGECRFTLIRKPHESFVIAIGLVAAISIAITGSLAGFVDTTFPARSLRVSLVQDFSTSSYYLLRLRLLHPIVAVVGGIYAVWLIFRSSARQVHFSRGTSALIIVFILQIALGALNVIMLAPVWLQILHLFIADLFWILLVLASANLLFEDQKLPKFG